MSLSIPWGVDLIRFWWRSDIIQNTKKSWHPNTLKNQERVWKAEQAAANEQRRIQDLQSEIKNERSREEIKSFGESTGVLQRDQNAKLDWMYKHPDKSVNAEEYLLGKSIDKNYENKIAQEKLEEKGAPKNHVEHDCIPFSIRNLRGQSSVGREAQVDLARKMQEDPLLAIKKREMESRAQMLQNPLKLMELKRLLVQDQEKRNIQKLAKKSKKNKDLDVLLAKKLQKMQSSKKPFDLENLLSQKSSKKKIRKKGGTISDSDSDHHNKANKKKRKHRIKDDSGESDHSSHYIFDKVKNKKTKGKEKEKLYCGDDSDNKNPSNKTNDGRDEKNQKKNRSPSPQASKNRGDYLPGIKGSSFGRQKEKNKDEYKPYTREKDIRSDRNRNRSEYRKRGSSSEEEKSIKKRRNDSNNIENRRKDKEGRSESSTHHNHNYKKKDSKFVMTEEEKERKRREMMQNATERDSQRALGLTRRDDEDAPLYDQSFIHKQLRQATATGTVQDRIRSNVNNIQRSNRSMDVNFARR